MPKPFPTRSSRSTKSSSFDEAHERSLNIDFLLGYLHRLAARRPDLKIIITSATIDAEKFAAHFGGAPVLNVSGRTYPVEIRYRPPGEDEDTADAIVRAVAELDQHGRNDILVFLPSERDIREAADRLRREQLRDTDVLPLFGRLSLADQQAVFRPQAPRRIVLATNVAETSLTVPRIKAVIDTGTARISRYSLRTKTQRLPIEPISQAAANQRAGRCGRVSSGICIRLYSEEDYTQRPAYTEPEILRTNLAAIILQMLVLKLGDIAAFPFVDAPDERQINDGYRLLFELQATDESRRLTPLGRHMARLPVDPRFARILVAAEKQAACKTHSSSSPPSRYKTRANAPSAKKRAPTKNRANLPTRQATTRPCSTSSPPTNANGARRATTACANGAKATI